MFLFSSEASGTVSIPTTRTQETYSTACIKGRHALGTIAGLYQAYKKLPTKKRSLFQTHLTLLDIHATAITRDLCMLTLLHELSTTTDALVRVEIKATLMYSFCAAVMPGYCYDRYVGHC